MRLLNTETYSLKDFGHTALPQYAILSHRWNNDGEIQLQELDPAKLLDARLSTPQLDKIRGTCHKALENGLQWVWIDSCCFDKTSSEEMVRSINSMFRWYQQAAICYAYLTDVDSAATTPDRMFQRQTDRSKDSEWFERGWTLQELLAPAEIEFFDTHWQPLGSRASLAPAIAAATGIDVAYLHGAEAFRTASIATRLSWQATRTTTLLEDTAYSLVGILGVTLTPVYGEGRAAWMRLQEAVLAVSTDESLFAWTASRRQGRPSTTAADRALPAHSRDWPAHQWGLLAPWVDCFAGSRDVRSQNPGAEQIRSVSGTVRVPGGVKFPILASDVDPYGALYHRLGPVSVFVPPFIGPFMWKAWYNTKHRTRQEFTLTLNCWKPHPVTGMLGLVQLAICRDGSGDSVWRRTRCGELGVGKARVKQRKTVEVLVLQPEGLRWAAGTAKVLQ